MERGYYASEVYSESLGALTTLKAKADKDGKKDRMPTDMGSSRSHEPRSLGGGGLRLSFAENPSLTVSFGKTTRDILARLMPYSIEGSAWENYSLMVDLGAKSLWEATTGVLREVCALAAYPLHYRPIRSLDNQSDPTTLHACYRPILMGIASQIRRHLAVIVLNDGILSGRGGSSAKGITIVSSLPRDQETGPDFAILRSIKQTVFIHVVLGPDEAFYPLIVLLKKKDGGSEWRRFLPQSLLLDAPMDQSALLSIYTKCIPGV